MTPSPATDLQTVLRAKWPDAGIDPIPKERPMTEIEYIRQLHDLAVVAKRADGDADCALPVQPHFIVKENQS